MKTKLFLITIFACLSILASAQPSSELITQDTRNVNNPPTFFRCKVRADFKFSNVIGLNSQMYSTLFSLSPWWDISGGGDHQFALNETGIYYRMNSGDNQWQAWRKLLVPDLSDNVGVGVDSPEHRLDVNGTVRATELLIQTPVGDSPVRLNFGVRGDNTDPVSIYRQNTAYDKTDLRIEIGDNDFGDDRLVMGATTIDGWKPFFVVQNDAKVGIGVENPQNALDVNGTIRATEIIVATDWADFVFSKDYVLPSLDEVKNHIEEHKHLPGIPSEAEVKENGVALSEMTTKMMQKIEELTLYVIQQDEIIRKQGEEIEKLKSKNK